MSTVATARGTLAGVLVLRYGEQALSGWGSDVITALAEIEALHSASRVLVEPEYSRVMTRPGAESILGLLELVVATDHPRAARPNWRDSKTHEARDFGARALMGFERVGLPRTGGRQTGGLETALSTARAMWEELGAPLPVARLSLESPLEVVVVITLESATAVAAFAILVEAIGRLYRGARGLELDKARIDTLLASFRADQADSEASRAASERLLRDAVAGVSDLSPASEDGLSLTNAEASIEEPQS